MHNSSPMRFSLKSLISIALVALLTMHNAFASVTEDRPNILVLLTDDQSFRSLGVYGNKQVKTPHLDKLAEKGIIFDRAYDTTSICMASRAQVFTGMYEFKTGTNFQHGPMTKDIWQDSYQVKLRDSGYFTGFVGKFGFAVRDSVDDGGAYNKPEHLPSNDFDVWYGWPSQGYYPTASNKTVAKFAKQFPHVTQAVGAASIDFFKQAKEQKQPFLLSVSFKAPHKNFSPDPAFDHVYKDTVWDLPKNVGEQGARHIPQQAKSGRQYVTMLDFVPAKYQENMRKYHQLVYGVDQSVGMILNALEEMALADNTVILFLTDNGYSLGAHDMSGKVLPYEEPSRTPMIAYDPRAKSHGKKNRVAGVTSNLDIAPTVFELANIPIPKKVDGKSLLPFIAEPKSKTQDAVMLINAWGSAPTHSLAVVTDSYKYIYWPYANGMEAAEELYSLENDQYEMVNLVNNPEYKAQLRLMRTQYDAAVKKWQNETVSTGNYPEFGRLYDRSLTWQEKMAQFEPRMQRMFTDWKSTLGSDKAVWVDGKIISDKSSKRALKQAKLKNKNKKKNNKKKSKNKSSKKNTVSP